MVALVGLTGCKDLPPGDDASSPSTTPRPTPSRTEDARAGSVSIDVNEQVLLDIGEYNQSIGDAWGVIDSTDPNVADADMHIASVGDAPGGPSEMGIVVTGKEAGETTLTIQYCYRAEVVADCDQGETPTDPIEVTITVE